MGINSLIRYLTLLTGWSLMIWVVIMNYGGVTDLLIQLAIFILWVLFPYYLYFFVSRKETRFLKIFLPALVLNSAYVLAVLDYSASESSTSALVFVVLPVFGVAVLGLCYLILYLYYKFKPF
jgi:hypothetical protein